MEQSAIPKILPWSSRLLALIGGLAMATTGELDIIFLFLFLGLFLFGLQIVKFPRLVATMSWMQPVLATLFLFVGIIDFFFLSNSFLLSVAHFLLGLQGLRLLAIKTVRENLGSVLLSSLMILSASTLAVEWTFFVMLFLFLPTVIWTLILQNFISEAERVQESSGSLREGSLAWGKIIHPMRLSSLIAFLVAILCCIFVFIVFPRFNFQGFRGRFLQPVHKSGFTKQVDLKKSGKIFSDDSIVMRVELNPDDYPKWIGYLRGSILDKFNGITWQKSTTDLNRLHNNGQNEFIVGKRIPNPEAIVRQSIYLESMESSVLFAAPKAFLYRVDRPFLVQAGDSTIQRPFGDAWRMHYEVESVLEGPYEEDQRRLYTRRRVNKRIGLKERSLLSLSPEMEKIQTLAQEITASSKTPLHAAALISRYLSTNYKYTLNVGNRNNESPLDSFLFEKKEGHCEYFASAMSVMLRSLDVPSRLVTGFYSKEWNERGHYIVVRMKHAHSWVEAFIEPYGWIEFDPSPIVWDTDSPQSPVFRRFSEIMDFMNLRWNRYVLSYDLQRQIQIGRAVMSRSRQVSSRLDGWLGSFKGAFQWYQRRLQGREDSRPSFSKKLLLGPIGGLIILVSVVVFVFILRGKSARQSRVWFYTPLLAQLEKRGGKKPLFQTLREFIEAIREKMQGSQPDVDYLSNLYYQARFDPAYRPTDQSRQEIEAALKRLKKKGSGLNLQLFV